jgi:sentrin-specific protease 1
MYVDAESGGKADLDKWTDYWDPSAPQQTNGSDCGVFTCKTAEVITRGGKLTFRPEEIKNQRQRMIVELRYGRLLSTTDEDSDNKESDNKDNDTKDNK